MDQNCIFDWVKKKSASTKVIELFLLKKKKKIIELLSFKFCLYFWKVPLESWT